jgi:type II secretory pathway pseudopilin PulG
MTYIEVIISIAVIAIVILGVRISIIKIIDKVVEVDKNEEVKDLKIRIARIYKDLNDCNVVEFDDMKEFDSGKIALYLNTETVAIIPKDWYIEISIK